MLNPPPPIESCLGGQGEGVAERGEGERERGQVELAQESEKDLIGSRREHSC